MQVSLNQRQQLEVDILQLFRQTSLAQDPLLHRIKIAPLLVILEQVAHPVLLSHPHKVKVSNLKDQQDTQVLRLTMNSQQAQLLAILLKDHRQEDSKAQHLQVALTQLLVCPQLEELLVK